MLAAACGYAQQQSQPATNQPAQPRPQLTLDLFELEDVRMKSAFAMWSAQTNIPLVVNWNAIEQDGIDIERPVTMSLQNVPSMTVLNLMMQYCTSDGFSTLVLEAQPNYLEMTTKRQALRRPIVMVYNIRDLVMDVPNFTSAPSFNLTDALSNTNSGGGGNSGGGEGIFGDEEDNEEERPLSRTERGEQIAQLIRDTIEPDIWLANGGEHASVRYFNGRLIIRAPQYVHGLVRQRL